MNEETSTRQHLLFNAALVVAACILSAMVMLIPWQIGLAHTLVAGSSLVGLCYSYYRIQSDEIHTLLRIFIALDCLLLATVSPIAFAY